MQLYSLNTDFFGCFKVDIFYDKIPRLLDPVSRLLAQQSVLHTVECLYVSE